jgi:hypothetical protein
MARSYRASIEGNVKLGSRYRRCWRELGKVEEKKRDPRNDKSAIEVGKLAAFVRRFERSQMRISRNQIIIYIIEYPWSVLIFHIEHRGLRCFSDVLFCTARGLYFGVADLQSWNVLRTVKSMCLAIKH